MAIGRPHALLQYLRRYVFDARHGEGADGELLRGFIERKDEAAFASLVRRHGPMVFGVCQRILNDEHDAEDAFQATFLVLVRKAKSIVPCEMVGNWLHGVAYNTAIKARALSQKRRSRERALTAAPEPAAPTRGADASVELKELLDQELSRLPDKYRVPIILCHLEGQAHHEAAQQLGWPDGTLSGRLSRGRALLAKRLARRGLALSAGSLAAAVSPNTSSACPSTTAESTVKAAMALARGRAALGALASPTVTTLVEGVLKTMFLRKFIPALIVLAVALGGVGTGALVYRTQAAQTGGSGKAFGTAATASGTNGKTGDDTSSLNDSKPEKSKIRQLQEERLAALKEIAAEKQGLVRSGRINPNEWLQADTAALKAELEFCESDQARVVLLEKLVANAKEVERVNELRFKAARIVRSELLTAKAARLEAEIEVEKARATVKRR
jgi:RNA polymerase sigma factor (sigma-70 family)